MESGLELPGCCVLDAALTRQREPATIDVGLADAARRRDIEVGPDPAQVESDPPD